MSRRRGQGFTLIELLVVIAIVALLVSILLPVLAAAKASARNTQCQSNLHMQGVLIEAYRTDNKDFYPMAASYRTATGDPSLNYNHGYTWWLTLNPYHQIMTHSGMPTLQSYYSRIVTSVLWCPDTTGPLQYMPDVSFPSGVQYYSASFAWPQYAMNNAFGFYDYYSDPDPSLSDARPNNYVWKGYMRDVQSPSNGAMIIDALVGRYANYASAAVARELDGQYTVYGAQDWGFRPADVSQGDNEYNASHFFAVGGFRHPGTSSNSVAADGHVASYQRATGTSAQRIATDKARFAITPNVFSNWLYSYP